MNKILIFVAFFYQPADVTVNIDGVLLMRQNRESSRSILECVTVTQSYTKYVKV